jgi:hypothetical protein
VHPPTGKRSQRAALAAAAGAETGVKTDRERLAGAMAALCTGEVLLVTR